MKSVEIELDEGDRFELTCEAEGTPFPVVTWYKNDVIYRGRQQSGHEITPGGIDFKIDFNRVDIHDQGTYVCNVSNSYGSVAHSYKIDVKRRSNTCSKLNLGLGLRFCWFFRRWETEVSGKDLSEQSREQTNSTHI